MVNDVKLFENKKIRSHYDENYEKWYFSVADVVAILVDKDYQGARTYWKKLAQRLRD